MTLTTHQLHTLRHDLVALATIEYDDVMAELLDHYASLTEQKMDNGLAFDEASKWAWADLGSGAGLQKIQDDYEKGIERQVRTQHLAIIKNYFRWPMLVTTALVSAVVYLIVPMLSHKVLIISIYSFCFAPSTVLIWGHFKNTDRRISTGPIIWKYLQHKGFLAVNFLQIALNSGGLFFDDSPQHWTRTYLPQHPNVSIALALLVLLYTSSFIQLYRYQFYHKIAL